MGDVHHKEACPRCTRKGRDTSKDNLTVYSDGSAFCFACGYTKPSKEWLENNGYSVGEDEYNEEVMSKEKLTKEDNEKIKGYTGIKGHEVREITDETYRYYGVRHKYSEETGEPVAQYYPITEDYEASGYKVRELPKTFSVIGKCGKESDLFGQWRYKSTSGKFVVITAGEIDCLSAHQMFEDERKSKGSDFDPIPVVSATIGETGSAKQISNHYEWLDRFDKVIVCYDMDAAGQEALATLSKVIPKGKMFSMSLPLKDINLMLTEGKQKQFITAFWKAQPYTPDGIIGSGTLSEKMREELATPKIPLPHFMHKLQKMMAGGIPLGRIVNLGSASGTGKSTIIDEMLYFWVFNSPHKIGVVSLESDSGQYGLKILSRHCGKKIELFETPEDALSFMEEDWVKEKEHELLYTEDGNNRWHLVEDRDGGTESMKKQIEKLIIECGCKVIVLDPLQDILDGLSNEDQAIFLKWMKGMIKSHKVTFINVNHVRKSGSGQKAGSVGGEMHEEDFAGSSTIFKSGACNLIFSRNKEAEDPIERNTTYMRATKIRWTGITGVAGEYYYDLPSHTLWDKQEWLEKQGQTFY